MATLTKACQELFRRRPDERYSSLDELMRKCQQDKQDAQERWAFPQTIQPAVENDRLALESNGDGRLALNHWSFSQLCALNGVNASTLNKLSADTTRRALEETMPTRNKPLQLFTADQSLRSIHGPGYTRLFNSDLLAAVREVGNDFGPPPVGINDATGLYVGEQDMFCFLIDPTGWVEIQGEAFAPGMFVANSETGRRCLELHTFFFQESCANHLVYDAVDVVEYRRKHTTNIRESLDEVQRVIENLVKKRDERRDNFATVIEKAMRERLGSDAEEVLKVLSKHGIPRGLAKEATEMAQKQGVFSIFSVVDALTRISRDKPNAGERTELDTKSSQLLTLVS